jgi:hypothetical protein
MARRKGLGFPELRVEQYVFGRLELLLFGVCYF